MHIISRNTAPAAGGHQRGTRFAVNPPYVFDRCAVLYCIYERKMTAYTDHGQVSLNFNITEDSFICGYSA